MEVVNSLYNSCYIPGGRAEFILNEKNLTLRVSVLFESCHCKFEKTLTSFKDIVPNLEAMVRENPSNLYKILETFIPEHFRTFIKGQVPSSKFTQSKGEIAPKRNHSEGEGVRKSRSGSLNKKDAKTKSESDITNCNGPSKSVELKNIPKGSKFLTSAEATQSKTSRSPRNETSPRDSSDSKHLSSGEETQSKTRRSPRDETSPKERKKRSESVSSSPPDASQGSFTSSDSKSLSPRPVTFDFPLGKGSFDKHNLVFEANVCIEDCQYNFKKNVSTVREIKVEVIKENPSILFDMIFSKHFDPFFKFEKPNLLAQETLSKIYFGNGGKVPPLPPEVEKIWNSTSQLTKQKFCESHTLFFVHETDIIHFSKALEGSIEHRMQINHHISPEDYDCSAIKCPYYVLIANDPVRSVSVTFEDHVKKLKEAGGDSYEASNLIEAAFHRVWSRYNKQILPKINIKCQEAVEDKHMLIFQGNSEREIEVKPGQEKSYKEEGILGVIRFLPLDKKL